MFSASPVITARKNSVSRTVGLVSTLFSLLLIAAGAVGLLFFQQPLQQSQDLRGDAMVTNGEATISVVQAANTTLKVNQPARLDFRINTANIATKGLDLVFNVETEVADVITFQTYTDSNFEIVSQEVEGTGDGFLVSFVARPRSGSFTTNTDRMFLSMEFTPQRSGAFKINFDQEDSKMIRVDNNQDTLKAVGSLAFNVEGTTTSAGKACNETCSSNSECQANHRCYDNRCRLVTNPSSTSCSAPPDLGLQRQCNEYCADTRECASGFTCFYNRCRQPGNPDSSTCQLTTEQIRTQIAQNCNKSCGSNADCSNNMRCFQGQCRLASNPSSTSCSALTQPTVSQRYITGPAKGAASPTPLASARPATGSATVSPIPSPTATPSASPLPTITPVPLPEPTDPTSGVPWPLLALGAGIGLLAFIVILSVINGLRNRRGGKAPQTATKAPQPTGYEAELQAKIENLKKNPAPTSSPTSVPAPAPVTPPPSTLTTQTTPLPAPQPTPLVPAATAQVAPQVKPAVVPTPVPSSQPTPSSQPAPTPKATFDPVTPPPSTLQTLAAPAVPPPVRQPMAPRPISSPLPTTQAAVAPSSARTSSMMDRLRQKAITPPGQGVSVDIFKQNGT